MGANQLLRTIYLWLRHNLYKENQKHTKCLSLSLSLSLLIVTIMSWNFTFKNLLSLVPNNLSLLDAKYRKGVASIKQSSNKQHSGNVKWKVLSLLLLPLCAGQHQIMDLFRPESFWPFLCSIRRSLLMSKEWESILWGHFTSHCYLLIELVIKEQPLVNRICLTMLWCRWVNTCIMI